MNACKPHGLPSPSSMSIPMEKPSLTWETYNSLPGIFRGAADLLERAGKLEIIKGVE